MQIAKPVEIGASLGAPARYPLHNLACATNAANTSPNTQVFTGPLVITTTLYTVRIVRNSSRTGRGFRCTFANMVYSDS